jgi:hypothetical protein
MALNVLGDHAMLAHECKHPNNFMAICNMDTTIWLELFSFRWLHVSLMSSMDYHLIFYRNNTKGS